MLTPILPRIRVLVIDDSLTMRALIEQILVNDPHIIPVGVARDVVRARELILETYPQVITLDISLPGINGFRFLQEIMSDYPLPVVMLSASTTPGSEARRMALSMGAVACFDKSRVVSDASRLTRIIRAAATRRVRRRTGPMVE